MINEKKPKYKVWYNAVVAVLVVILGITYSFKSVHAVESIKFATLAPKGSTWMKNFAAMAKEIQTNTDGKIKFRFYANGIQGDELDVISKMRNGLLHAGAMTATGLGEIKEEVLIFQLPRLFRSYEELDYVRNYLNDDLDKAFMDAGYVLIGMGDIGFYYIFSDQPIKKMTDLQNPNVKVWVRSNDKISLAFSKIAKIATVPRDVTQVMSSLYSGHLNTVTVSPYVVVALQWHDKFKYMTKLPVSIGVGATVITKEKFESLSTEQQKVIRDAGKKYQDMLKDAIRKDNETALDALVKKAGIKIVEFEDDAIEEWDAIAAETQKSLVGDIYSQEFLDKINGLLKEFREKK